MGAKKRIVYLPYSSKPFEMNLVLLVTTHTLNYKYDRKKRFSNPILMREPF
jgi:hypothetical protein